MINTTNPVHANVGVFAGIEKTGVETGGFDFWNYLLGLNSSNLPENLTVENLKVELPESERKETKKEELLWNPMFPQVFTPASDNFPAQKATQVQLDAAMSEMPEMAEKTRSAREMLVDIKKDDFGSKGELSLKEINSQPLTQKVKLNAEPEKYIANFEANEEVKNLIEESVRSSLKETTSPTVSNSIFVDKEATVKFEKQEKENRPAYSYQPLQGKSIDYLPEMKEKFALSQVKKYFNEQKRVEDDSIKAPLFQAAKEQTAVSANSADEMNFSKPARIKESAPKNQNIESLLSNNKSEPLSVEIQNPVSTQVFNTPKMTTQEMKADVPQLMSKVHTLAQSGGGKMVVTLNPPHLGEVEVSVTTKGKKVEIEMISENSASKSILESHFSELKNSIQAQDMVVAKFEVSVSKDFDLGSFRHQNFESFQSQSQSFDSRGSSSESFKQSSQRQQTFLAERNSLNERADFKPVSTFSGRVDLKI